MEITITGQLQLFLVSIGLGLSIALLYDLFRAVRLRFPRTTRPLDALMCLLAAVAVFLFCLSSGGELRLYLLLGISGGAVLYFCLLSELLRPIWSFWVDNMVDLVKLTAIPLHIVKNFFKKTLRHGKNLFHFLLKWDTIWNYKWTLLWVRRKGGGRVGRKGKETEKGRRGNSHQAGDSGAAAGRGLPALPPPGPDHRSGDKPGAAGRSGGGKAAGKRRFGKRH
ncbi:spore cortex biosynthesis protein YabQ [Oscillibacter sp. MSJ-2]|uniref:Spore cortex biosynthesis protein YabQ n=1 Tax=Dysosmobacter acutus TaxID=2841504 RepID=A0ABS6F621_9FIRM|nr:spore cortex biosynthesis protein YabQ [Dysosmobacter acutus]